MTYETFDHTADVGLRVCAASLSELFSEAARGLFSLIVTNLADVQTVWEKRIELEADADELEYLFFDWLNELLFLFETEHVLLSVFDVEIGRGPDERLRMSAICRGEPLDGERHELEHEVKAVTYHGLRVAAENGTWQAEVILDI